MTHVVVYKTALLSELDTVRHALTEANIPFYVQTDPLGGPRQALEAWPTAGFGTRYLFVVPKPASKEAKALIATLHVTYDSDKKPFPVIQKGGLKKTLWLSGILVAVFLIFAFWAISSRH